MQFNFSNFIEFFLIIHMNSNEFAQILHEFAKIKYKLNLILGNSLKLSSA